VFLEPCIKHSPTESAVTTRMFLQSRKQFWYFWKEFVNKCTTFHPTIFGLSFNDTFSKRSIETSEEIRFINYSE
jgi:hypothetical protein